MTTQTEVTKQINVLRSIICGYGLAGALLVFRFGPVDSWRSFLVGWVLAVVNFELIRRLGLFLLAIYDGKKLDPMFYLFLLGKLGFWGFVFALFSAATWIQGVPFALGGLAIVIAGLGLALTQQSSQIAVLK